MPNWLTALSTVSLVVGAVSALILVADVLSGHGQRLRLMNWIWAGIALYAGPVGLAAWFTLGRTTSHRAMDEAAGHGRADLIRDRPLWHDAALAANETGVACLLGSLLATLGLRLFTFLPRLTPHHLAPWVIDYFLAILCGLAIQYWLQNRPRAAPAAPVHAAALRVEPLSVTAWQIGYFGWMVFVTCVFFPEGLARITPVFWFFVQCGMALGFLTAYPVNLSLVRSGLKTRL